MIRTLRRTAVLVAACAAVSSAHARQPAAGSLTLIGPGRHVTLSVGAIHAMHQVTLRVINNHAHAQQTYTGVPLVELMHRVGAPQAAGVRGAALSQYVIATGSDHYHAVLSLAEIEPAFHPGTVLVADTLDGKPLDTKEGPLRLIVEQDHEPARWVHNLVTLELRQAQ